METLASFLKIPELCSLFLNKKLFLVGYHSVYESGSENSVHSRYLYPDLSISSDLFEQQLVYLKKRGHTFIRPEDVTSDNLFKIKKPTLIFFDDGYKDNFTVAVPILKKYEIPATIFITTGFIDRTYFQLTGELRYWLSKKGMNSVDIEVEIKKFKSLSHTDRLNHIEEVSGIKRSDPTSHFWIDFDVFLERKDIEYLTHSGIISVGSHGVEHKKLTECSPEEIDVEIKPEQNSIAFSYPHGRVAPTAPEKLKNAGYAWAVSTVEGYNSLPLISDIKKPDHIYALKKIAPRVYESMNLFRFRLYVRSVFRSS
jgi:peptidoglycan/xylan/chitin deacetylase (PgdA/CDA1 family)